MVNFLSLVRVERCLNAASVNYAPLLAKASTFQESDDLREVPQIWHPLPRVLNPQCEGAVR